jgi:hypothetical protein
VAFFAQFFFKKNFEVINLQSSLLFALPIQEKGEKKKTAFLEVLQTCRLYPGGTKLKKLKT